MRETGFLLSADQRVVIERSLAPLYQQLATAGGLRGKQTLNVEGLAVAGDQVFFLNRGNSGPNLIFRADLGELAPKVQRILKMDEPARIREAVERLTT